MNVALVVVVGTSNDTELGAMRQEHTYLTFFKTLVKKITSIFVKKIAFSSCRERFCWCLLFQARKASPIYNFAFTLFSSFQFICSLFFQIIWIVLLARAISKWSGLRYYNIHNQIKKELIYLLKKGFCSDYYFEHPSMSNAAGEVIFLFKAICCTESMHQCMRRPVNEGE